jgi:hypothetical protein
MAAGENFAGSAIDRDSTHRHLATGSAAPGIGESRRHGIGPEYRLSRHTARVAAQRKTCK